MAQDAYDFLEQEREQISRRINALIRLGNARIAARRVALMPADAVEVTAIFMGTPTGAPRLERQSAIRTQTRREQQDFFLTKTETPPDFECAICLDEENKDVCAYHPRNCHVFHHACLNKWMNRKQYCPMCRAPFDLWFI